MFLKRIKLWIVAGVVLLASNVFAGTEDWTGTYLVKTANGKQFTIVHTPLTMQFMFFNSGGCLFFGKNTIINDITMPEDVSLCTNYNVDVFTAEIQKFSKIIHKKITLGPNYSKN